MNKVVKNKLKMLPNKPGVYFHKNKSGQIIYVGKAANLNNRVRQYFQNSRSKDQKTLLLVADITDIEWQETSGEAEALFLEAELVKRYQPKYNILLRDDKSNVYIRINIKDVAPSVTITRRPLDDGAQYFGPFLAAWQVKKALKYLRKAFPFSTHITLPSRACLDVHLGLCPGPEALGYNRQEYLANLNKLIGYIKGSRQTILNSFEKQMKLLSRQQNFEEAAKVRNRLLALKALQNQIIFGDREALDISKDNALTELTDLFNLPKIPRRIEAYDISHLQGTDTVASMVVFASGIAEKASYRKFKMRLAGNDDFAHMAETLQRRFSANNLKKWPKPSLVIIDGGKGQLTSAKEILNSLGLNIPTIGLAKARETIIVKHDGQISINTDQLHKLHGVLEKEDYFSSLNLPLNSNVIKLLQRIRDESHRFAVTYHSSLRQKRQTSSLLDEIPGVGPSTKRKLLKHFGSFAKIQAASIQDVAALIGGHRAGLIKGYLKTKK